MKEKLSVLDKFLLSVAPRYGTDRLRARLAARNYGAAQYSHRTTGWARNYGDANAVNARAIVELRLHARDLGRNNGWAQRGLEVITGNTVSWGITPKAKGTSTSKVKAMEIWREWAETTQCDADGMLPFSGLQELVLRTVAESGECLTRRRWRRPEDGLRIPMQLQVLEPDFLDTGKDNVKSPSGGQIIQGVEFDQRGKRTGYWMFDKHPGSGLLVSGQSYFVPASEIIHTFRVRRPGQVRGISWFAQTIAPLKDFDEYQDATLMRQKIAACFAAFKTDDGLGSRIGAEPDDGDDDVDQLEPGMIVNLPAGKEVTFANPPQLAGDNFDVGTLRRIAAGLGVTYEELTGDFSQVNFSSARMSRLAHWANVYKWRWHMMIPSFCDGSWRWAMEAAVLAGEIGDAPVAVWTGPPMPMIEPDKEGLALSRLVRAGTMTHDDMVREQGGDPDDHWLEYAEGLKKLDALGILLDSDVRAVSQAGLTQVRAGAGGAPGGGEEEEEAPAPAKKKAPAKRDVEDVESVPWLQRALPARAEDLEIPITPSEIHGAK
jgi:lambda family phage portal protein